MRKFLIYLLAGLMGCQATRSEPDVLAESLPAAESLPSSESLAEIGGQSKKFRIPLPKGYDWEVTQSWAKHCSICDAKGYFGGGYCSASHSGNCCEYSWDFNLPGSSDEGKAVLASADGFIKNFGWSNGWGNYVLVDHGSNICTRYAHLLDGSIDHLKSQQFICQGLQLGQISGTPNYSPHLHFQFEDCGTGVTLPMGFEDGNNIPICTMGGDVYNSQGQYDFLKLTNTLRTDCGDEDFVEEPLPGGGWLFGSCGPAPSCPLGSECERAAEHEFSDVAGIDETTASAASYLWGECAIDGKSDGRLKPEDKITRAEALKVALFLFGLMDECADIDAPEGEEWYFQVVACAVKHGMLSDLSGYFSANAEASLAEASYYLVQAGMKAGKLDLNELSSKSHFKYIPKGHWASEYLEKVRLHGGFINSEVLYYDADQSVSRGEFVVMAASLSSCWCRSMSCAQGCSCNQQNYGCTGNSSPQPQPQPEPEPSGLQSSAGLQIDCQMASNEVICQGSNSILKVVCSFYNNSGKLVQIKDLKAKVVDAQDAKFCQATKASFSDGLGYDSVYSEGKFVDLGGYFEFKCSNIPFDKNLFLKFDLLEKMPGDTPNIWHADFLQDYVQLDEEAFCNQQTNQAQWSCDPNLGYPVFVDSPGGWVGAFTNNGADYFWEGLAPSGKTFNFQCGQLPIALQVHGGSSYTQVTSPAYAPDAMICHHYGGDTTYTPNSPTCLIGKAAFNDTKYNGMLLVFPPPQ